MFSKNSIPAHWKEKTLGEVFTIERGGSPRPIEDYITNDENGINWIKIGDTKNVDKYIKKTKEKIKPDGVKKSRMVFEDDFILSNSMSFGKPYIMKTTGCIHDGWLVIRKSEEIDNNYLYYILGSSSLYKQFSDLAKGSTVKNLNIEAVKQAIIRYPPLPEQQAIVDKIEELFSELENGKQRLLKAQEQLKVYRQSLLKAAFEGKLTNKNVKDGELPEGWKLTNLGEYLESINSGKSYRCDERPPNADEVGIIKVSAVTWGVFDERESKTCFSKDLFNANYIIKKGDFLFSRANTIEFIGACVIVEKVDRKLMLSDKILRFAFSEDIQKEFALYYLRSRNGRKQIERLSSGNQDSMRNIGQEKIRQIEFPYCSMKEQQIIVSELKSKLTVCEKIEESISLGLQQAEMLRQGILKRAFEGRLL